MLGDTPGSVQLIVRISQKNDLILDLESVVVNGQRYGVKQSERIDSRRDDSLI